MHKLIIEDDEGKAVAVPLIRDEITVGRQEGNTIRLTERNVSRRHAKLTRRDGVYFVEDLSSYTGTKVNGVPISGSVPLNDGDHVSIADYKLGIKVERPAQATAIGFAGATGAPAAAPGAGMLPGGTAPMPKHGMAVPAVSPAAQAASAPPEPMEGAPTIPVRTLADQGVAAGGPPPSARLVVAGGPLQGQEISIDRSSLVIGRTGESDVVLNHKSISRQHAKIIHDGDRYVVVDLQSANGVRVNGVEYERVELQPGDIVELGHVRMRFVIGDDLGGFDVSSFGLKGSSHKPLLIGGGIAAVVLVVALVMFAGGGGKKPAVAMNPVAAARPATAVPAVAAPAAAAPGETPETLLGRAREAFKAERWSEASALVGQATAQQPALTGAEDLRKAIDVERQNEGQFQSLKRASEGRNYDAVLASFAAIPEGSLYKEKAKPLHDEARGRIVGQRLAVAEKRRTAGDCEEVRKEVDAILLLDPENRPARDLVLRCAKPAPKAAVAARPAPRAVVAAVARPTPAPRPAPVAREEAPAPTPAGDPQALVSEARDAWMKQQYALAIDAAKKALKAKPGMNEAYKIIAVCSCSLSDANSATKAYDRLDDTTKQQVRQMCARKGVTLE